MIENNFRISEINMFSNILSKNMIRQTLFLGCIIFLFVAAGCASSQSAQSGKHRKPVSTGKRKCGCSMLTPSNHIIQQYQQTYYVLEA